MPEGLHERILQATLGTTNAHTIRASLPARIAAWWQGWIDALAAPQLATMATMILMAMIVGTTAADNSTLSNMYRTSLRMAAETYARGASTAARGAALSADFSQLADEWADFVSTPRRDSSSKEEKPRSNEQTTQPAQQQR